MNDKDLTEVASVTSETVVLKTLPPAPQLAHVQRLGVDIPHRKIYLNEIVEEAETFLAQTLHELQPTTTAPIEIWLDTPGGDVNAMFAIHDLIRIHAGITVVGYGQVASAGVLILACAQRRLVTESCVLMSHEPKGIGDDEGLGFRAAKDRRKWEDWMHTYWCELMSRYTPKDASWWKRTTERQAEYWLLGGAAIVEAGLADEVMK